MNTDRPVAATSMVMQSSRVRLRPKVSISAVMNGPSTPRRRIFTEMAPEIVATSQPKARCSGTIITPGAERTPTAVSEARKVTPSTIQA
jgi:hypothetical protein